MFITLALLIRVDNVIKYDLQNHKNKHLSILPFNKICYHTLIATVFEMLFIYYCVNTERLNILHKG